MKKIVFLISFITLIGCNKFLDIQPKGKVIPETTQDFQQLLESGYRKFPSYKELPTFRSDEVVLDENSDDAITYQKAFSWEAMTQASETISYSYADFYTSIFYANQTINEGAKKMPESAEKKQILAEAYALRAYNYFGLITLYGKTFNENSNTDNGVPLVLDINLEGNFQKESVSRIYQQILSDLEQSEKQMQTDKQLAGDNYRFSKISLYALASRVHLYLKNYEKALENTEKALAISQELTNLNSENTIASKYDSKESILALEKTSSNESKRATFASPFLISLFNQENDLRFPLYFSTRGSNFKIEKTGDRDYKCSFRNSELFLTKAESLANINQTEQAKETLFSFVKTRYKSSFWPTLQNQINSFNKELLIQEILNERMREFVFEGHRWFDLVRTQQKEITHSINGRDYTLQPNDPRYVVPFPKEAIQNNKNL